MLCSGMHHRYRCPCFAQERTHLAELIVTKPLQVVQHFVNGIHTLVTGSMAALSMCHTVNHHQSLLGNGRIHSCWFADYRHVNRRQFWQNSRKAILPTDLLFARSDIYYIIRYILLLRKDTIHLQQTYQSTSAVVSPQSV